MTEQRYRAVLEVLAGVPADSTWRVCDGDGLLIEVARTTTRPVARLRSTSRRGRAVRRDEPMTSELVLTDPWWDLRGGGVLEQEQRDALTTELAAEISEGHRLHGHGLTVLAKSEASDDVLVALAAGGWAVVHLTWSRKTESPPWPWTTYHPTVEELQYGLQEQS